MPVKVLCLMWRQPWSLLGFVIGQSPWIHISFGQHGLNFVLGHLSCMWYVGSIIPIYTLSTIISIIKVFIVPFYCSFPILLIQKEKGYNSPKKFNFSVWDTRGLVTVARAWYHNTCGSHLIWLEVGRVGQRIASHVTNPALSRLTRDDRSSSHTLRAASLMLSLWCLFTFKKNYVYRHQDFMTVVVSGILVLCWYWAWLPL